MSSNGWSFVVWMTFLLVANAHVMQCYRDDQAARRKTKPFLISLLLLGYILATKQLDWFLVVALLTSWIGDVLLIPKGDKWFTAGGISFGISHVFFILCYLPRITSRAMQFGAVLALTALIYFTAAVLLMRLIWEDTPKKMRFPMAFYLITNATMNLFAASQLASVQNFGALVAYIGALLFFISDCCLYVVRYYRRPEVIFKKHYTVMCAYLLGEGLITIGMMWI